MIPFLQGMRLRVGKRRQRFERCLRYLRYLTKIHFLHSLHLRYWSGGKRSQRFER